MIIIIIISNIKNKLKSNSCNPRAKVLSEVMLERITLAIRGKKIITLFVCLSCYNVVYPHLTVGVYIYVDL